MTTNSTPATPPPATRPRGGPRFGRFPSGRSRSGGAGRYSVAAGIVAMALVGSSVGISRALVTAPLLTAQAIRYGVATAVLLVVARVLRVRITRPRGREWLWLASISATGLVLFNIAIVRGVAHTGPAMIAVAVACVPVLLSVLGPLLQRQAPRRQVVLAAVIVTAGAVLVEGAGRVSAAGLAWAGVALACEASFTLLAIPVLGRHGAWGVSVHSVWIGAVMLAVLGGVTEGPAAAARLTASDFAAVAYLAVLVTVVAFVLWYSTVAALGPARRGRAHRHRAGLGRADRDGRGEPGAEPGHVGGHRGRDGRPGRGATVPCPAGPAPLGRQARRAARRRGRGRAGRPCGPGRLMEFHHAPDIWADFPELAAGAVFAQGVGTGADVADRVAHWHGVADERLAGTSAAGLPEIQAWRRAFARMGLKPTQYRCASESLLRRYAREHALPAIHPVVDLGNAISLAYAVPVAVLDVSRIAGALQVRYAEGTESYLAFSGETERPRPREVIFADAAGNAHARRWTNRQSALSAVQPGTTTVLIVAEAMHETGGEDIRSLISAVEIELAAAWRAATKSAVLTAASPGLDSAGL